jgi:UDP-N-acetylglucosamine--dolichyl-phosphate N-acetylglucosaminephosphotransferase
MIEIILAILSSFLITLFITPIFIRFLNAANIVGVDVQKKNKPKVAEMGGPVVLFGFLGGIFLFIWVRVFFYGNTNGLIQILSTVLTLTIVSIVGIFDDLFALIKQREGKTGFEKYKRIGLKQWQKPLLILPAAIPLMAVMAGYSTINIPLLGTINLGIFYPLFFIPVAIIGASNVLNMLAGFNGLEAGLGFVSLTALGVYAYIFNEINAAMVAFTVAFALLAILKFNWYPAKIFVGDSLPYLIGATIASVAIIGNIERFAVLISVPWILEFILKSRSKFQAENFGVLQKDGTLKAPYNKTYSLTHVIMKVGKFKEYQVTAILIGLEVLVVIAAFYLSFIGLRV